MITQIRKMIKGKAAKTLLILIVAAVGGVFTIPVFMREGSGSPWVAKINGSEISYQNFMRKSAEQEERIRDLKAQYGQLAEMLLQSMGLSLNPQEMALDQLVREELVDQLVDKLNVHISEDFIYQMLADKNFVYRELSGLIPPQLIDPQVGLRMDALKQYLQRRGLSMSDFEHQVEKVLKRSFAISLALGILYLPESEIRNRFMQRYAGRSFSVLTFDFASYMDKVKKDPVPNTDLKQFFDVQNKLAKRYWVPERRSGKVWEFDSSSYGVGVSQEEIQTYYDDQKIRRFVEKPVKLKVRKILIAFDKPEDRALALEKATAVKEELITNPSLFETKARELSDDQESAKNGGLLPEFSRGTHSREFEKAAFLLENDGDISEITQVPEGFVIVQRVTRIPAQVKSLAAVEGEIKELLAGKKFKDLFYKEMKQFMDDDSTPGEREVVLNKALTMKEVGPLMQSDDKVARALFRANEGGYNFYTENEKAFVVETTMVEKQHLPSLESIEDTVKGDLYESRAEALLKKDLEEARKQAGLKGLDGVQATFGVKLDKTGMIKLDDANLLKSLREKGLPVDEMVALEKIGNIGISNSEGPLDGYLFVLDQVEPLDEEKFANEKAAIKSALQMEKASFVIEALVAFLHRTAKIEINESIINLQK